MMTVAISGCSHKTTVSEASNHIEIKSQETLINTYVADIQHKKSELTAVAPELDVLNNPVPVSVQSELSQFLLANDCSAAADKDACFKRYRLVIIKMSRRIDFLQGRLFVAKGTISNLINNLNGVIDGLGDVKLNQK